MNDYAEIVTGRIVDKNTNAPVKGAQVEVYDKDLIVDDYLGTTTTGEESLPLRYRPSSGG